MFSQLQAQRWRLSSCQSTCMLEADVERQKLRQPGFKHMVAIQQKSDFGCDVSLYACFLICDKVLMFGGYCEDYGLIELWWCGRVLDQSDLSVNVRLCYIKSFHWGPFSTMYCIVFH